MFEQQSAARAQLVDDARRDPTVAAVMARFPQAEIVDIRFANAGAGAPTAAADGTDYDNGE
jgi:DNA polymerase-3 subunit gamma/tau